MVSICCLVHISGLPCSQLSRVSLYFMGTLGQSVLLLVVDCVDVLLDVDCHHLM